MRKTVYIIRLPQGQMTTEVRKNLEAAGNLLEGPFDLILTGSSRTHFEAGQILRDRKGCKKFISTSELDLHPELNRLEAMGTDQAKWFNDIPKAMKPLVWSETKRLAKTVTDLSEEISIVLIDDSIIDAVTAALRTQNVESLEDLAKIQQVGLDLIAVKLVMNGNQTFAEDGGVEKHVVKEPKTFRLESKVEVPRWPGEHNPVW